MFLNLITLYNKGEYNVLLKHFAQLDKKNIKDAKIENLKGLVNYNIGNYKIAISFFKNAIDIEKNYIDPYINIGTYYFSTQNIQKAKEFFLQAHIINNKNPVVLNHLGMIEISNKNFDKAQYYFQSCINYNPAYSPGFANLGNLFYQLKNFNKAIKNYLKSIAILPNYECLKNLGFCYFELQDLVQSNIYLKKALSIKLNSDLLFQISYNYKAMGDLVQAEKYLNQSIQCNPGHAKTIFALSRLKHSNVLSIDKLKKLFEEDSKPLSKAEIGFSLFHLLDKEKQFKDAAYFLDEANKLIFELHKPNTHNENREFAIYKNFFNKSFFDNKKINKTPIPSPVIFIVGMPRSGSTLVEQIISSHSKVVSLGETNRLFKTINDHYDNLELDKFEKLIQSTDSVKFKKIMTDYLSKLPIQTSSQKIFTDKMLSNFRLIGFIKAGLPEAKIIFCQRDARDNCFSIYSNYFEGQTSSWIYNKNQLVDFFYLQKELMNHWTSIFNEDIYTVQYETFVNNLEHEVLKLFKFLGLNWESQCLDFEKNSNIVLTASSLQVRQKIYTSSIGLWKPYKNIYNNFFNRLI